MNNNNIILLMATTTLNESLIQQNNSITYEFCKDILIIAIPLIIIIGTILAITLLL